jgi:signal transduction histidine kinase
MTARLRQFLPWILAWGALAAAGVWWLANKEITQLREQFEVNARIMHRVLSQRAVQHEAILATLGLLQTEGLRAEQGQPERRLSSLYSQILRVERRTSAADWSNSADATQLRAAESVSRASARPALGEVDFKLGRFWLVQASQPTSFALQIDNKAMVPWTEWPASEGTQVSLEHAGQNWILQPSALFDSRWRFEFRKALASESQPFDVVATRCVSWAELPWAAMLAWCAMAGAAIATVATLSAQRRERARAEELLRLGRVVRLNTLGELAAGMAHELNQPLTAVLANTQAATRLLNEAPADLTTARTAMQRASEQARRASDVLSRLRRIVERPQSEAKRERIRLSDLAQRALYLLEPQSRALRVSTHVARDDNADPSVWADPVALEQVIHNLLTNALHALERVDSRERTLTISISQTDTEGTLTVTDNGAGIAPEALARLFEPFFTTRSDGLGLGLSLCESLVTNMQGTIIARNCAAGGAEFIVSLPLALPAESAS